MVYAEVVMSKKINIASLSDMIVGVQPMTGPAGKIFTIKHRIAKRYEIIDQTIDNLPKPPEGYLTIEVDLEISKWIEENPIHMWKFGDVPAYSPNRNRYTISSELYSWLILRWS